MTRLSHIAALLLFASLTHCLTTSHAKFMEEYASPRREFNTDLTDAAFRITEGRVVRKGEQWLARFSDVLIGSNRFLSVESSGGSIRLAESRTPVAEGETAYILQQNACCLDEQVFHTVLFAKPGDRLALSELLKKSFNFDAKPAQALAVLDFTTTYNVTGYLLCWQDSDRLECKGSLGPESYIKTMNHIRWDVRSRAAYVAMHGWYLIAFPVDVLTSPFQAAALLLTPLGVR